MCWYVLFVKTGKEFNVEKILTSKLDPDLYKPFTPKIKTICKISRLIKKETKLMFPSYVFIESQLQSDEFGIQCHSIFKVTKDILKVLNYGNKNEIAVRDEDCQIISDLCNNNLCMETSTGVIIGDKIYIKEGPLMGMESIIRKIDRHKRQATIALPFMGTIQNINVALEIVEKQ